MFTVRQERGNALRRCDCFQARVTAIRALSEDEESIYFAALPERPGTTEGVFRRAAGGKRKTMLASALFELYTLRHTNDKGDLQRPQ
jgi:hypothetical protein